MKKKFILISCFIIYLALCANHYAFAQSPTNPTAPAIDLLSTDTPTQKSPQYTPPIKEYAKPYIEDKLIVIGTGAITGVYYPAGGAICRLVNKDRKSFGIRCAVESTPGSIYNLDALRAAEVDFAIVQSDWQEHAYNGTGVFTSKGRFDKLRFMFSLHNEAMTLIVAKSSQIEKLDDIKGKSVNFGPIGSGVRATMSDIMKAKGWSQQDFKNISDLKPSEQARALCNGSIDAIVLATGHPNGLIQEVTSTCETKFINLNDEVIQKFVAGNPDFAMTSIPGGLYAGIPDDVATFGVKATVVSTSDTSVDIAYNVTKLVFDNLAAFKSLHPVFAQLSANKMATEGRTSPYHPGALKYFQEKQLVDAQAQ